MAITEAYSAAATISTTEYSLPNNSTTLTPITFQTGIYQVYINVDEPMQAGDTYVIKIKEEITSGGSQRTIIQTELSGLQPAPWVSPSIILMHGWDVTMQKTAGTDRSFGWSIRKVA